MRNYNTVYNVFVSLHTAPEMIILVISSVKAMTLLIPLLYFLTGSRETNTNI